MKKFLTNLALGVALLATATPALAQDAEGPVDLLAGKTVTPLGGLKIWPSTDGSSYTCNENDLQKMTNVPVNTSKIVLFPQGNEYITKDQNYNDSQTYYEYNTQTVGIQGFYIELEESSEIGNINIYWDGAYPTEFSLWVTEELPTANILTQPATYNTQNGTETEYITFDDSYPSGKYLVVQPLSTTIQDYGWGVGIKAISAYAPSDNLLTTFKVSPGIVLLNTPTDISFTALNQLGVSIPLEDIKIEVSENATYDDSEGTLTINSGSSATFTATYGEDDVKEYVVYSATAPGSPDPAEIKTPIFTNGDTQYNSDVDFITAYQKGAKDGGNIEFSNGEVARLFTDTYTVYLYNPKTIAGSWNNNNIQPSEDGYKTFNLDVFSSMDIDCTIWFEGNPETKIPETLKAGEWNNISIDLSEMSTINNMSIRFNQDGPSNDILLANIYLTPAVSDGYYLAIKDADGNYVPNPSYKFQATSDDSEFTLTVGSVDVTDDLMVVWVNNGENNLYGAIAENEEALKNGTIYNQLSETDYALSLDNSYLNVTFTLTVYTDKNYGVPSAIVFNGTVNGNQWTITPGNDQTMQDGKVTTENGTTTISITTVSNSGLAYIYVPNSFTESTVYYTVTATESNSSASTVADEVMHAATVNNGYFTVLLKAGYEGTISVYTSNDSNANAEASFAYVVAKGIPTGIESVEAYEGTAEYYNLQGVKVHNPENGVFIKVSNGKASKVVIRN